MSVVDAAFARHAAAPTGKPIFGEDKVQKMLKKQAGALIEVYYQSAEISKEAERKRDKYVKAYEKYASPENRAERARTQRVFEKACERTERLLQVLNDLLAELGIEPMVGHDQCAVDEHNRMVQANAERARKEAEALRRRAARAAPARGGQYDVPMGYVV